MDMTKLDVLVIGGGPGGTPAAMALAAEGRRVRLVEKGTGLGGTCLFEGCIPSKILHESARRLLAIRSAAEFGLRVPAGEIGIDWNAIMERKATILNRRAEGALQRARRIPSLSVQFGNVTLLGPHLARIIPHDGKPEDVEFSNAIIATGSVPNLLPITGGDLPQVITSEQLLEIEHLPKHLVVIGAGPIGVEMAQIFAAFGTAVTLLEAGPRILAPVDEESAIALQTHVRRQGIVLELGAQVLRISGDGNGVRVEYRDAAGAQHTASAEYVLAATGRSPNVGSLGLEHTAVHFDRHGVKVDGKLETDEPGIYAAGDVVGQPMFAHWATAQALALAGHLLGRPTRFPEPATNSAVIFSIPELGIAGLTESEARRGRHTVGVARYDYHTDARAQVSGHADGLLKVIYDTTTRAVLGIHVLVEGAASLIGEGALAIRSGIPVEVLATAIHSHPTLNESMGAVAREIVASSRAAIRGARTHRATG